ncbi:MAG: hypothetical protein ACM3S4_13190 [Burkholderiales bacterium]
MTLEDLMQADKDGIAESAKMLSLGDIADLVAWLSEKNDAIRYPSLLLLESRSRIAGDVYPYRETFREKLKSDNSFQRSIGAILIAANARWDDGWLDDVIGEYLELLNDEKPITVRQCVQRLKEIVPYKPKLHGVIAEKLLSLDLGSVRETMRKLVLTDILEVFAMIRKVKTSDAVESYIMDAMTGGLLDKKAKKHLEELLNSE